MVFRFPCRLLVLPLLLLLTLSGSAAFADSPADLTAIREDMRALRENYERRIADLEAKLRLLEAQQVEARQTETSPVSETVPVSKTAPAVVNAGGQSASNANNFNPSIGIILNGRYGNYSNDNSELRGFAIGEEGERGREGFAVDESEINASANVDDKFSGSVTAAVVREDGADNIELEEAFVQTLPGVGFPPGLAAKFGRALWTFGYLNEHHTHADDFADRPLPYRAFLNSSFNDDGLQLAYVLPTDFYGELGGGIFRGDDFPFGSASGGAINAWSGYARIGGDIGEDQNWRFGGYFLGGDVDGRSTSEDVVNFVGDTQLYATDLRYTWAPTGNSRDQELILQAEYIWRIEDGAYQDKSQHAFQHMEAMTEAVNFDEGSSGFYAQAVYKFLPQWRLGGRYSQLFAADVPAGLLGSSLDSEGYDPLAYSFMIDWTNSEFSRFRLQFNREELSSGEDDNQFILQYIMSLGAHGAHAY